MSASKQDNTERNARIIDLARQGKQPAEIARELRISRGVVNGVVRRARDAGTLIKAEPSETAERHDERAEEPKPEEPVKHPSSPNIIDVPPSGQGFVNGGVPPKPKTEMEAERKPFFLNPRTATLEDVANLFRQLTGREPTAEEIEEARQEWEDEWLDDDEEKSPK